MANILVERNSLSDIADSIRAKNGTQTTYKPSEMAAAIDALPSGGITPTGGLEITANGTYDVTQYASAEVDVPQSGITPTGTVSITQNGTTDVTNYASASVSVPNSYSASDEGKVVSNGALVAQTSDTVTQNGTVDTTLIDSLTVNVSGGGSSVPAWVESVIPVTIDSNSVTNTSGAKTYFTSYEPYAVILLKSTPDTNNQCVALFGLNVNSTLRYRNGTVASAPCATSYDAKLIEGTTYEVWKTS